MSQQTINIYYCPWGSFIHRWGSSEAQTLDWEHFTLKMQKITLLMIFYRNYFEVFFLLLQIAFISQTLIVQFIIQKTGFGGGLIDLWNQTRGMETKLSRGRWHMLKFENHWLSSLVLLSHLFKLCLTVWVFDTLESPQGFETMWMPGCQPGEILI